MKKLWVINGINNRFAYVFEHAAKRTCTKHISFFCITYTPYTPLVWYNNFGIGASTAKMD